MIKNPPLFSIGDKVISFRGERATIIKVREVLLLGKSHRVEVHWDDESQNPDQVEYYEEVFTHDNIRK